MIHFIIWLGIAFSIFGICFIYNDNGELSLLGLLIFLFGAGLIFIGSYSEKVEPIYNEYQLQSGDIVCCSTISVTQLTDLHNCLDNKTYYSQSNVIKLGVCEE